MAVLDLHMVECQSAVVIVLVQDVVDGQCDAVNVFTDQASVQKGLLLFTGTYCFAAVSYAQQVYCIDFSILLLIFLFTLTDHF